MTKQLSLILEITGKCNHLTADQIFLEAKKRMPTIAIGTIYRNLNALVEKGMLKRVKIPSIPDRFDSTLEKHEHLFCDCCGSLKDIYVLGLDEYIKNMIHEDISSSDICLHYNCENCHT